MIYESSKKAEAANHIPSGVINRAKRDEDFIKVFGDVTNDTCRVIKKQRVTYTPELAEWLSANLKRLLLGFEQDEESLVELKRQMLRTDIANKRKSGRLLDIDISQHAGQYLDKEEVIETIKSVVTLTQAKMTSLFINNVAPRLVGKDLNGVCEVIRDGLSEVYGTLSKMEDI